jgi:hypothetical protein
MRRYLVCLLIICLAGSCSTTRKDSGPPTSFIERPLTKDFLREWETGANSGMPWTRSPLEVAIRLWAHPNNQNFESPFTIDIHPQSGTEVTVDFHEHSLKDDSVYELYTRITLRRSSEGFWKPVSCQEAWKGRGRSGWTTIPTI